MIPGDGSGFAMYYDMQDAFRRVLGLRPVDDIAFGSDAVGVSRLVSCPPLEPITAVTLVFSSESLSAHLAISTEDAWEHVACADDSEARLSIDKHLVLSPSLMPASIAGWTQILASLRDAGNCIADDEEVRPHFHRAFGDGEDSLHAWFNPRRDAYPAQCKLIDAYGTIRDHILRMAK